MKKIVLTMMAALTFCMSAAAQGVNFIEGKTLSEVEAQAQAEGKLCSWIAIPSGAVLVR